MLFSVLILAYTPKKILSFFAFLAYTRLYPKKNPFFVFRCFSFCAFFSFNMHGPRGLGAP